MKFFLKNNIIKSIFFTLIISLSGFTVNATITDMEKNLTDSQKRVYYSLSSQDKEEIQKFYISLNLAVQKRYNRKHRGDDFLYFLDRVNEFLNSQVNPRIRTLKACVIGISNLQDGSYIINARHLKVFTLKSKSSINGGFQHIGYINVKKEVHDIAKGFFGNFLSRKELRQWSVRARCLPQKATINELSQSTTVSESTSENDYLKQNTENSSQLSNTVLQFSQLDDLSPNIMLLDLQLDDPLPNITLPSFQYDDSFLHPLSKNTYSDKFPDIFDNISKFDSEL